MPALFKTDREIGPGNIPADVLAFWRAKGLKPSFAYQDVWKEEHELAFSAAKIMRIDVLEAMRSELERAISQGFPFDQFVREVTPRMQALGWWAPHDVVDPQTGKTARVNPPRRLRTIFDTNMRTARAVGQWDRVQRNKRFKPYLLYQVGVAERHRPEHLAWHGLLLSADDSFWQTHYPPCGWLCHCTVRAVSRTEADRLEQDGILAPNPEPELDDEGKPTGHVKDQRVPVQRTAPPVQLVPWRNARTGKVEYVPKGVDPGFNYPPGEGRRRALTVSGASK